MDRVEYTITREGYVGDWNADDIVDGQDLLFSSKDGDQELGDENLESCSERGELSPPYKEEVITVTEQTMNPRTGELEYWFSLDTRTHPDTKITVTAEIFPVDGPSVILDRNVEDILGQGYSAREFIQWTGVNLFSNNTGRWNWANQST